MDPITGSIVGSIVGVAGKVLDKIFPDPIAQAGARLELLKLQQGGELEIFANEVKLAQAQAAINTEEAKSDSVFIAGWRPFIGWICGSGLAIQFVVSPIGTFVAGLFGKVVQIPNLDLGTLMTLLFGMLGLGAYRTAEKIQVIKGKT